MSSRFDDSRTRVQYLLFFAAQISFMLSVLLLIAFSWHKRLSATSSLRSRVLSLSLFLSASSFCGQIYCRCFMTIFACLLSVYAGVTATDTWCTCGDSALNEWLVHEMMACWVDEQCPEGHHTRKRIHFRTDDDGLLCRSFYNVYEYVKIGSNRARAAANMSLQPICATQIGNCGLDLLIIMCTQHFRLPSFWNTFIIILCASNFNAYRIIIFLVTTKRSVCDASSSDWTAVFTSSLAMLMVASNQRWIRSRVDASVG